MGGSFINIVSGVEAGTGAKIEVKRPGVRPKVILLFSNDLASNGAFGIWWEGMPDGWYLKFPGEHDNDNVRLVTTEGITQKSYGFDIGTDGAININTKDIYWVAFL